MKHISLSILDNARDQGTLDETNEVFGSMSTNLRGSLGRMGRMARQGDKVAVVKLAAGIVGVGVVVWVVLGFLWRVVFGR